MLDCITYLLILTSHYWHVNHNQPPSTASRSDASVVVSVFLSPPGVLVAAKVRLLTNHHMLCSDSSPEQKSHKTERKFIILKISLLQSELKNHWNTFRDRMIEILWNKETAKEREETACHGSHFLKTQFHRMTTQKLHVYIIVVIIIIIIIIIELLNYYLKSHTLIQSKQFALWLLFHPIILSHDQTWQILVALL